MLIFLKVTVSLTALVGGFLIGTYKTRDKNER